ncbi:MULTISPECIES: hypothetical protein [unclassified Bradyrhizobium]
MKWCAGCDNSRWVCENHPDQPWLGVHACTCGGAGMPCPFCNKRDEDTAPDLPKEFAPTTTRDDADECAWSEPEPATSFRTINGIPIFWRGHRGVVRACEGADIHADVRLFWTLCGKDAPADAI